MRGIPLLLEDTELARLEQRDPDAHNQSMIMMRGRMKVVMMMMDEYVHDDEVRMILKI